MELHIRRKIVKKCTPFQKIITKENVLHKNLIAYLKVTQIKNKNVDVIEKTL